MFQCAQQVVTQHDTEGGREGGREGTAVMRCARGKGVAMVVIQGFC